MSDSLKNFQLEALVVELVYITAGSIANTWFQSFSILTFWGYESSFIDMYKDNTLIYFVLFFGMAYVVGLFLREVGGIVYKSLFLSLCKFKYLNIFSKHFTKGSFKLSYKEIISKIDEKSNRNYLYFLLERNRARYIGHKIFLGFFTVNFIVMLYYFCLNQVHLYLPGIFFFLCIISAHYLSKSSKSLASFINEL